MHAAKDRVMHIFLRFGRLAAVAVFTFLSGCATNANFASSASIAKPNPALGAFLAAHYAESIGDSASAARFYVQALKGDPQNQELLEDGFLSGLLAGSPAAAQLASRLPNDALATLLLANKAAMNGYYNGAARLFESLPDDELTILMRPLLLAWTEFGQGHAQEALKGLKSAFNSGSFGQVYQLNAALIADAAGDKKQAAQFYATIQNMPPNLRMTQILASWYARSGDIVRANALLSALVMVHPDLTVALPQLRAQMYQPVVSTPQQGLAEAYLTMAASLSQPQALFLRTVLLRFALTLRPDLSSARLILANTILSNVASNGQPGRIQIENALAILAAVPPQDPLYVPVMLQEASLNAMIGKPDAALALLTPQIAKNPDNVGLLVAAGDIRRHANQCDLALPYYQKAISLAGSPPPVQAWSLYFDRGLCEDAQGNWAAAEPDIKQALGLAPTQPYVLNYLAYRWAQQGKNLQQARQMLLQALAFDPNDGALLDSLGFIELKLGNTKQALTLLIEAVQLLPGNAEVNAHLGDAFHQAGQNLQAIYQWDRALTMNPDAALEATIKGQIQQTIEAMTP